MVEPIPDKSASTVAKALHRRVILKYGAPLEIVSDRGSEFLNSVFKTLAEAYDIKHLPTTAYHPEGNAATERGHRFFNGILKIARNKYGQDWDDAIHYACAVLNTIPLAGTIYSPFELMHGFKARAPADAMIETGRGSRQNKSDLSKDEYMRQIGARWNEMDNIVKQARLQQIRRNRHANQQLKYDVKYNEGDLVLVYRPTFKKGVTRKLLFKVAGPYEVVTSPHPNVYKLRKLDTKQETTHNVRDICPYITRAAYQQRRGENTELVDTADLADLSVQEPLAPVAGDFLLFPATIADQDRGGINFDKAPEMYPFFLCKVLEYNEAGKTVRVHYYNSYSAARPKLRGYLPCWKHTKKDEEQYAARCPRLHEPMEDPDIPLDEFCQLKIHPKKGNKQTLTLDKTEIRKALQMRPQIFD